MDITPPITTSNIIGSDWNQADLFLVLLTAVDSANTEHDTPAGVKATYYTIDGSEPTTSSPSGPNLPPVGNNELTQFEINGQGIFVIKYFSEDNNGNREFTKTDILKIDGVAPVTTMNVSFLPDGDNDWYKTNPTIELVAVDLFSGVDKIYYRWNDDIFQEYVSSFQIPSEGIHTLQFYSVDNAGNVEDVQTEFFRIDNEAPLTQDDAPSGLQKEPVTVRFLSSDNASGVVNTHYTTDGSTPDNTSPSGSSVLIEETGQYIIKYFSIDFAGNEESVKTSAVELFIDTEAPQTFISESFPIDGDNGWYRSAPYITLSAVDPSGINAIKYKLFPSGLTTTAKYTGTVDLSGSVDLTNNYNVRLEVDQSGQSITVDLRGVIPSQTTIAEIISNINTAIGSTIATETDSQGNDGTGYITLTSPTAGTENTQSEINFLQPLTHDATNEVFGLDETSYPHTFSELVAFYTYISPLQIPYDGIWQIEYYAIDNVGNQGETGTKTYKLDSTEPETIANTSIDPDGLNGWYTASPEITITSSDEGSGIYKTFYQWDAGLIEEYIDGTIITIPGEGQRLLKIYSIDLAGNIENLKVYTFKMDGTNPVTTDTTSHFQGIIFTAFAPGLVFVDSENSDYFGTSVESGVTLSIIKARKANVKSIVRFFNSTKGQNYHVISITGVDLNELKVLPLIEDENSTRLDYYKIQLNASVSSPILRSFDDVLKIHNISKGERYEIDRGASNLLTGELVLSGIQPIDVGDDLEVTYAYNGPLVSPSDILEVDYYYDWSQEVNVLNTIDYTLLTATNTPRIHDHDIVVGLLPTDNIAGVTHTFYTIDGTDPEITIDETGNVTLLGTTQQGISITLTENGTYPIKYFSLDAAGNQEVVKTAPYPIIIDKNIPSLNLVILPDPFEDGENGWYKNNFAIQVDISTDDIVTRINEEASEVLNYKIDTSINDTIDFEETSGTQLTAVLPTIEVTSFNNKLDFEEVSGTELTITIAPGIYSTETLSAEIENQLNIVGSSNYTVNFAAQKYTIVSNLTGGIFNVLFDTGTNSNISLQDILGFEKQDLSGSNSYTSDSNVNTYYVYDRITLANVIETELNTKGSSNYVVTIVNDNANSVGYNYSISSDLSGGAGIFNILWSGGTNSFKSIGKTIAFDVSSDDTGSSNYISDYFKIKLGNYFAESILVVKNTTTLEELTFVDYDSGGSGFIDELIVDGNIPSDGEKIEVDYKHYVGIEKVDFGLDTINLTTSVNIYNDLEKFVGIFDNKVNFRVIFPALSGQFFLQDGQHTVYAKTFDYNSLGNTGVPQKESNLERLEFKLDRKVPVTTDNIQNVGWQQGQAVVVLTPIDEVPGSGIAATHYTLDGNTPTRLSPKIQDLPDEEIIISQSGIYTVKYFSVDVAGNIEPVKTATYQVFVDANAPETVLVTSPTIPNGQNGWFSSQPTISFSSTDFHSGVDKVFYKLTGDLTFTEYTGSFLLPNEGEIEITFYAVDNVGNKEEDKVATVKYDETAPNTTTNIPATGYTADPVVRFTINDDASGGLTTYFTIDGSTPDFNSYSGSEVEFQSSGTYIIKFFSLDNAGNVELVKTQTLNLDLEIPTISDFSPAGGIVDETTTEISFRLKDDLSGVDISTTVFEVDGIEYSSEKNTSYFSYTGTPADYLVTIYPVQGVLNFQNIEVLRVKNVSDFAGNFANVLEYNFIPPDTSAPRVREVYPVPNAFDVSTEGNVVTFINDDQSGVDIRSVVVTINEEPVSIVAREILQIKYVGAGNGNDVRLTIKNALFRTTINEQPDININLTDENYNTIKKLNDYLDSLSDYTSTIVDSRYQQNQSVDLLNVTSIDITTDTTLELFIPDENLNFAFIERDLGYIIFVTPSGGFEHDVPVSVSIDAKDNNGNIMETFSYMFTPSRVAELSIEKRNYLHRTALTWINDIQNNIASNYTRSRSTHFYGHHKALGIELSRVQEEIDHINEDASFTTVRDPFLYQKFGYLLQTRPIANFSTADYRRLLLSLLEIFFQGSTKDSLERGVSLFTGSDINIVEVVFAEGSDISDQFVFTADLIIGENRLLGLNLQLISQQLDGIFNLVKPAHVFIIQRFVWTDQWAFQAGCTPEWLLDEFGNVVYDQFGNPIPVLDDSGFQVKTKNAPTAICDREKFNLDILTEEDVRTDCQGHDGELQTSNTYHFEDRLYSETITEDQFVTNNSFETEFLPLLKGSDPTRLAKIIDVNVTINGAPSTVTNFDAENGIIEVGATLNPTDVIIATYNLLYIILTDGEDVSYQFTGSEDSFYTQYRPILKDLDTIADISDVQVTVNGILVNIIEFHAISGFIRIDVTPGILDTVIVIYNYNPHFVYREFTFYLNDYEVDGNDFNLNVGSIFQGGRPLQQNVYEVYGGIDIPEREPHAHVCETFNKIQLETLNEDEYETPLCNDARGFFYLNNYTVDENDEFVDTGSYFNDINTVNRSTLCPYFFFELEDRREEVMPLPEVDDLCMVFDGRIDGFSSDEYIGISRYVVSPFDISTGDIPIILNDPSVELNQGIKIGEHVDFEIDFDEDEFEEITAEVVEQIDERIYEAEFEEVEEDEVSITIDGRELDDGLTHDVYCHTGFIVAPDDDVTQPNSMLNDNAFRIGVTGCGRIDDNVESFTIDSFEEEIKEDDIIEAETEMISLENSDAEIIELPEEDEISITIDGREDEVDVNGNIQKGFTYDTYCSNSFIVSPDAFGGILNDPSFELNAICPPIEESFDITIDKFNEITNDIIEEENIQIEEIQEEVIEEFDDDDISIVVDGRDDNGFTHDRLCAQINPATGNPYKVFEVAPDDTPGILNDPDTVILLPDCITDDITTLTIDKYTDSRTKKINDESTFGVDASDTVEEPIDETIAVQPEVTFEDTANDVQDDDVSITMNFEETTKVFILNDIDSTLNGFDNDDFIAPAENVFDDIEDELESVTLDYSDSYTGADDKVDTVQVELGESVYGGNVFNVAEGSEEDGILNDPEDLLNGRAITEDVTVTLTAPKFIIAPDGDSGLLNDKGFLNEDQSTIIILQ